MNTQKYVFVSFSRDNIAKDAIFILFTHYRRIDAHASNKIFKFSCKPFLWTSQVLVNNCNPIENKISLWDWFFFIFYEIIENAEIHQILQICIHCSEKKSLKTKIHVTTSPNGVLKQEQYKEVCTCLCESVCWGKDFWFAKKKRRFQILSTKLCYLECNKV